MDLVTVTYSGDLLAMRLQSHSLDRFITKPITHHVYIEDSNLELPAWHKQLVPFYSRHRLMLRDGDSLLDSRAGLVQTEGWIRQQAIKLLAAREVVSDRYMVLDSKNLFIKCFDIGDWPVCHGSGRWRDRQGKMELFLQDAERDLGLVTSGQTWTPHTPWIMHTGIARSCFDRGYVHYLLRHPQPYEFALYAAVAQIHGAQLDVCDINLTKRIYAGSTIGMTQLDAIHADTCVLMMSIHRDAIQDGNPTSQTLNAWLCDIGLDQSIVRAYLGA